MIGVEPEIIQCAPADRIGILVLRKGFAVPGDGAGLLSHGPRCAAITLVVICAVVCPTGFLGRCVKTDVADDGTGSQRYTEGLNPAIEVLVIQSILVVPDSDTGVGHFESHEPDTIGSRGRLERGHRRAGVRPGRYRGPPPDRAPHRRKCESGCAAHQELAIRNVVIHVALPGMRLAPGVFMRGDVLAFSKIGRALIKSLV